MLIGENFLNVTEDYRFGDSELYESFTDDVNRLFKAMQKEYGRCTGKVYIDEGNPTQARAIGWVFEKRMEYEDAHHHWPKEKRFYLQQVWVTLYEKADTITRKHHYRYI